MCGLLPYSKCLNLSLSGVTGHRLGCSSRLRIASLNPRYHFRAASDCSASISRYRWARSRSARAVRLTRYAMRGFEILEKLPRRPDFPLFCILQPLPDALLGIGIGGNIEQPLVRLGILHDGGGLTFHRKHHRSLILLELFHEVAGPATERCKRLNILGDVDHDPVPVPLRHLFRCYQNSASL